MVGYYRIFAPTVALSLSRLLVSYDESVFPSTRCTKQAASVYETSELQLESQMSAGSSYLEEISSRICGIRLYKHMTDGLKPFLVQAKTALLHRNEAERWADGLSAPLTNGPGMFKMGWSVSLI